MAPINSARVVRRSHSLLGFGSEFNYSEYAVAPSEEDALRLVKALRGATVEKREQMVAQGRLPAPGDGPTPEERQGQTFTATLWCEAADGRVVVATVSGGEHAYEETVKPGGGGERDLPRDTAGRAASGGRCGWLLDAGGGDGRGAD